MWPCPLDPEARLCRHCGHAADASALARECKVATLLFADIVGITPQGGENAIWIVGLVDNHSRFLIGLRVLPRLSTEPILAWLRDCFALVGIPLEVMIDIGPLQA